MHHEQLTEDAKPSRAEADPLEEIKSAVREAVRCHFGAQNLPRIVRLGYVKDEVIDELARLSIM